MDLKWDDPPIHICFYLLDRFDDHCNFRNECPECGDGVLTMTRNTETGELLAEDMCILCGQRFIYDDIELVKKARGW
jgi:DNA-directed RNA polymerase subunit RPC12/RpoP